MAVPVAVEVDRYRSMREADHPDHALRPLMLRRARILRNAIAVGGPSSWRRAGPPDGATAGTGNRA